MCCAVAELDALEEADVPLALVAVTVYVYVPATVSVIASGDAAPEPVAPELEVTVNPVIVEPPVAPAVNATDTDIPVAVAVPIVGA